MNSIMCFATRSFIIFPHPCNARSRVFRCFQVTEEVVFYLEFVIETFHSSFVVQVVHFKTCNKKWKFCVLEIHHVVLHVSVCH